MENSVSVQVYRDLDFGRGEIRLIELFPGERSDPVCVRLFYTSLNANPHYEAISYVWGDPTATRFLQIGTVEGF